MEKLHNLYDQATEPTLLNSALTEFYDGPLGFPDHGHDLPYIVSNFVTSIDGRITLDQPGHLGGGEISLFNLPDRKMMAVLRTLAGGVLMGANTLRLEPKHEWTAAYLLADQPDFLRECSELRQSLGLPEPMPHFFLTGSGSVLLRGNDLPEVLKSNNADVCFLTTSKGRQRLKEELPKTIRFQAVAFGDEEIDLRLALSYVKQQGIQNLLCEGGPTVIGNLLSSGLLDEVFLTEAPHVVGDRLKTEMPDRKTWVAGVNAKHEETLLASLLSVKISGDHIFKRYRFQT